MSGGAYAASVVLVNAKDEAAKRFYQHFDFDPSPAGPMHLLLVIKEVMRLIKTP